MNSQTVLQLRQLKLGGMAHALQSQLEQVSTYTASLRSRETFWDIPVAKINSIFDSLFAPWPPCVRAPSPHHRKLGAGYVA
ncbi:MAG: hypothetical protein RPU35_16925, partial [Candidatus Sedimenticola sp. (ex Thyasira tokunagai)]